jgi:hypothetical protein
MLALLLLAQATPARLDPRPARPMPIALPLAAPIVCPQMATSWRTVALLLAPSTCAMCLSVLRLQPPGQY